MQVTNNLFDLSVPIFYDLTKGDRTIVGELRLITRKLPPSPFFSICLASKPIGQYDYVPVAASLLDDYNLSLALANQYAPGVELLQRIQSAR